MNRTVLWGAATLLGSLALSGLLWWATGMPVFLLFLALPFLFSFGRSGPPPRTCPTCGWSTRDPAAHYCPRDGGVLQEQTDTISGNP